MELWGKRLRVVGRGRGLGRGQTPLRRLFYLGLCRLRGIPSPPAPHDCAAGGPFSFAATKNRIGRGALLLCDGCGRAGATPAAFYLGLCRLRGILSLPAPHDCAAGGQFSFAATKNRIGRGALLLCDGCGRDRRHSGGFLLRIMPPSWHPVPACTPPLCSKRAVLYRHDDCAASIPKSGPEIKNRCTQEGVNGEILASIPKSEPEIKNRCTQKDVSGEKLAAIRKSGPEIKNRCTKEGVNRQNHALIPKSGPEIKNRCTQVAVNRENPASIRKSGPEIKNHCTLEGINRQNHASILKSGPEIKNRCMQQAIFSTRSLNESLWR